MASSAMEMRSPAVSNMSSSRTGRIRTHLLGEIHQFVGAVPHRGHHHCDLVTGPLGLDDPPCHSLDAVSVGNGRPTVLLHDQRHGRTPWSGEVWLSAGMRGQL
jgi:hypothetical protein